MGNRTSGPMCSSKCGPNWIDDGTGCRYQSPRQGPLGAISKDNIWEPYILKRSETHEEGPTGEKSGRGGFLEYNSANFDRFKNHFKDHMPSGLSPEDLLVLSTTFTRRYPRYRLLPPTDLWPNMLPTLELLDIVQHTTGVTMQIASAYRSSCINRKSRGSNGSKHLDFAALDILPQADKSKVRAFLKHYWWEQGRANGLGLGYYSLNRFHIDTIQFRRWKWNDTRNSCRQDFRNHFSDSITELIAAFRRMKIQESFGYKKKHPMDDPNLL